jgi:ATP-binding protein involved in chromosome partitioning
MSPRAKPRASKDKTRMTDMPSKERILKELARIKGPDGESDIVALGLVSEIVATAGKVYFSIAVPPNRARELEPLRQAAEIVTRELPGIDAVTVTLTAESAARPAAEQTSPARSPAASGKTQKRGVASVSNIIAVASGKGGVGKSTTAVNLALAFQANGLRVGLLDADVYGPSIPRLMGLRGKPKVTPANLLEPMTGFGLKVMSIGFLVDESTPVIWRGPMVVRALGQMLGEVDWGELDVLVVDMPPGTGDIQLSMAQQVPLAGAIIVSTPQDLALVDARKGLAMFEQVNVPVLGIVENMSYYLCPECGHRAEIFGHGGAQQEALRLNVPFLGEVPLHLDIRERSDAGTPIVASAPDSPYSQAYRDIAARAWDSLSAGAQTARAGPRIIIE